MSSIRRYCVSRYGIDEKDSIAEINVILKFVMNSIPIVGTIKEKGGFFNFYFDDGSDKAKLRILGCRYIEYETEDGTSVVELEFKLKGPEQTCPTGNFNVLKNNYAWTAGYFHFSMCFCYSLYICMFFC